VTGPVRDTSDFPVVEEAGVRIRAPRAAGIAGLLFAILFTGALVLIRTSPVATATEGELAQVFARGDDLGLFVGTLYVAPFAGIMFLWFIAVVRDLVGEREDRFFATVFFGSGLLFVALLFVASAVVGSVAMSYRYLGQELPIVGEVAASRSLAYTLLFGFSTRAAAVFLISMSTLGLRTGAFPRWLALAGVIAGVVLLLVVAFFDWILLLLPAWIAVASLMILRREWRRDDPGRQAGPQSVKGPSAGS